MNYFGFQCPFLSVILPYMYSYYQTYHRLKNMYVCILLATKKRKVFYKSSYFEKKVSTYKFKYLYVDRRYARL